MSDTTKKYRLLKDLPFLPKDSIFDIYKERYIMTRELQKMFETNETHIIIEKLKNFPDWFEPITDEHFREITKPLEPLKYRNGAVVEAPKRGTEYWTISYEKDGSIPYKLKWKGDVYDYHNLSNHNIFLTREEAETALHNLEVYNRIYKRIIEIDFENGWVCDWSDKEQNKCCVVWDLVYKCKDAVSSKIVTMQGTIYMSEQAKDWLMSDEVSDEEFKILVNY